MNIEKNKFLIAMARGSFTVNSLAKKSGIGRVTISCIKNGKVTSVQPDTLGKLAAALGVDVTELIEN
ncbi:DNA-binding Xre family transcriptional regulator [Anaerotaenia torta]|uniref:helix-turn-helix domain-containing protein n=1 Tax=Anaerotaenia torta TaxID=433293 RepID=UPI003D1B7889